MKKTQDTNIDKIYQVDMSFSDKRKLAKLKKLDKKYKRLTRRGK